MRTIQASAVYIEKLEASENVKCRKKSWMFGEIQVLGGGVGVLCCEMGTRVQLFDVSNDHIFSSTTLPLFRVPTQGQKSQHCLLTTVRGWYSHILIYQYTDLE